MECQQAVAEAAVVLLHGSAGSSALWKGIRDQLAPLHEIFAPDLIGYGESAPWRKNRALTLRDEARRVAALIPCCEDLHLVGYSYGGAVAMALAAEDPVRVRSLTLIEPVLFFALNEGGEHEALGTLKDVQARFDAGVALGEREGAMREFIDFWTGEGAWLRLPRPHRVAALTAADKISLDWRACFAFEPPVSFLRSMAKRTLLIRGDRSPPPMIRLVDALHRLMPGSNLAVIQGGDHLLPLRRKHDVAELVKAQLR